MSAPSGKKILIVDDEKDLREFVGQVCEDAGYAVLQAGDGLEGLEQARTNLPDLILCDINMPKLDGFGLIKALREIPETTGIPLIFLTGKTDMGDLRAGMQLGADDYLMKPFKVDELLASIEVRLKKKETLEKQVDRKLDEIRTSVLDSMPHELRTPLHGILGFAEILKASAADLESAEIEEIAGRIHKSALRLHRLLENFLLYAELQTISQDEKKILQLRAGRTPSIRSVVQSVAEERAGRYGRSADLVLAGEDSGAGVAEQHLTKIVGEIVDNAFKFSEPRTPVRITSGVRAGSATISTADAGRGMSAEQIHSLGGLAQFERKTYEQQGMGMGLSIARRLVELYGGTLLIESSPGKGTTVSVTLPA